MLGYVAVTDPGWYDELRSLSGETPRDANFWKPSPRVPVKLGAGTPFFFKLRAPHRAIAGFGYFEKFTVLPDWLAWEAFGRGNGVATLGELRSRLERIRTAARIKMDPHGRIGCCLIAEAVFFDRDDWVSPPADWGVRTQVGAKYDLSAGEGKRIWQECLARTGPREPGTLPANDADGERYGAPSEVRPRLGQGLFRVRVLQAYDYACAVTREHSLPALDAAHIRPFADGGSNTPANGVTLRSDIHRLFDRGYVTVDEDMRFVVSRRLETEFHNGRSYYKLAGTELMLPTDRDDRPSVAALAWHRETVFRG